MQRQHEHPEHPVGAVDEGEALLGGQLDRLEPGGCQRVRGGHQGAGGVAHLALPHQRQRAVRERREVARATQRAVLAHDRRDAVVEESGQQGGGLPAYPGATGRQRREPQQHQRPHHLALDLRAGAGGVRAHQRALQTRPHLGGDVPGRERPEPRRDAVRRGVGRREPLDHRAGPVDRGQRVLAQPDPGATPRHGHDLVGGEGADPHLDRRPGSRIDPVARHALHVVHDTPSGRRGTRGPPVELSGIRDRSAWRMPDVTRRPVWARMALVRRVRESRRALIA